MYIGLISDTHGVFSQEFKDFFAEVDQIWHAGDFGGGMELAEEIAAYKPLVGVAGNCDNHSLRYNHPLHRFFECEGVKVLMTHIGGYPGKYNPWLLPMFKKETPLLFVCGHSHILRVQYDSTWQMLTLNPGAAGKQGWQVVQTLLRFVIDGDKIHDLEVIELERH